MGRWHPLRPPGLLSKVVVLFADGLGSLSVCASALSCCGAVQQPLTGRQLHLAPPWSAGP